MSTDDRVLALEESVQELRFSGPELTPAFKCKLVSSFVTAFSIVIALTGSAIVFYFDSEAKKAAYEAVDVKWALVEDKLTAEVRETAVTQAINTAASIGKETILAGLVTNEGFLDKITEKVKPIPDGAILISKTPCSDISEGVWEPYTEAAGRFLVAVGKGQDSKKKDKEFTIGPSRNDGLYQNTLIDNNLPDHDHIIENHTKTGKSDAANSLLVASGHKPAHLVIDGPGTNQSKESTNQSKESTNQSKESTNQSKESTNQNKEPISYSTGMGGQIKISSAGLEKPASFDNLPPYIALYFCQKRTNK